MQANEQSEVWLSRVVLGLLPRSLMGLQEKDDVAEGIFSVHSSRGTGWVPFVFRHLQEFLLCIQNALLLTERELWKDLTIYEYYVFHSFNQSIQSHFFIDTLNSIETKNNDYDDNNMWKIFLLSSS